MAETVKREMRLPLDVVLNYSHMTLQNTTLNDVVPKFRAAGVRKILTASPLSMGLLRLEGPQPWHPATKSQREAVLKAVEFVEKNGHNMADTSMRFVFGNWDGTVIGGWSTVKELEDAVTMWHRVKQGIGKAEDEQLWNEARQIIGKEIDTMWSSPPIGWKFDDGTIVE